MSLKKHVSLLFASSIINSILNFISGILLTRILGAEGRGILFKIDGSINLLSFFVTLKSSFTVTYFTAKKQIAIEKLIGLVIVILLLSILITLGLIAFLSVIDQDHLLLPADYQGTFFTLYLILLLILTQTELFSSAFLRGGKFFEKVFSLQITSSFIRLAILTLAFSAGIFWGLNYTLKQGLLLHLTVVFAIMLVSAFFYLRTFNEKPTFRFKFKNEVKPFFMYSITTSMSLFMNFMNKSADIWFVDYFVGTNELGYYAVAVNLSSLLLLLPATIRETLLPYVASGNFKDNIRHLSILSRVNFTFTFIVSIILYYISSFVIPFLYGDEFQHSVLPFQLLLIGILFNGWGILFSAYNYGTSKPNLNLYANMVGVLVTLALDILLIPRYGIVGAAIASSFAYFISAILIFGSVIVVQKIPMRNYFIVQFGDAKLVKEYIVNRIRRK